MERSPEMIVGQLGVLKAGGVYVPMSPENPRERLEYLVGDTRPAVVLTQERLVGELPWGTPALSLDTGWGAVSGEPAGNLTSVTTVDSQMVVIYTSGSTGAPKGTVLGGRGYVNLLGWYRERMGLDEGTRYLQILSFAFDAALKDLLGTLLNGGCLVLSPHRYDPVRLVELVERYRVTAFQSTPTLLYPMLEAAAAGGYEKLRSLRCVSVIGEPTDVSRIRPWFESDRCGSGFLHLYGPTECSDVVTGRGPMRGHELSGLERLPVGVPVPGVRLYVLDARDELQPLGVPGELCVSGELLAQGYLNRPGLTAERFAVDPFAVGRRMYRTGDVARWRSDGELELLGRVDRQVKIRGLRIELGEIESQLGRHPSVAAAVVTVHEAEAGDRRLAAYVVVAEGAKLSARELREHLRQRLPEYMVPSSFAELGRLPLTPSGKTNLRALPAPDLAALADDASPPRDALELRLARLWEDVLGVRPIGPADDFFALGGHSLLATQLVARIERAFGQELPLAAVVNEMTVERVASRLRAGARRAPSPLVPIQPEGPGLPFFCVHPVGGHVLPYLPLARALGGARPFYGLQAPGLEGDERPLASVEAMAGCYEGCVRAVQPSGPYHLGGWSLGGLVALELARRLRGQGEEVALVALLDSHVPAEGTEPPDADDAELLAGFARELRGALGLPETGASTSDRRRSAEDVLEELLAQARAARVLPADADVSDVRRRYAVYAANVRAMVAHRPRPYPGRLTLIRAGGAVGPEPEWAGLAIGGLDVGAVPGDHYGILRPPAVEALAARLRAALEGGAD
jgi:amino acid adenylation domain-containing protein